jgi:hypothetical protein
MIRPEFHPKMPHVDANPPEYKNTELCLCHVFTRPSASSLSQGDRVFPSHLPMLLSLGMLTPAARKRC